MPPAPPPAPATLYLGIATALAFNLGDELIGAQEAAFPSYQRVRVRTHLSARAINARISEIQFTNEDPVTLSRALIDDPTSWWWVVYDHPTHGNLLLALPATIVRWNWLSPDGRLEPGSVTFTDPMEDL